MRASSTKPAPPRGEPDGHHPNRQRHSPDGDGTAQRPSPLKDDPARPLRVESLTPENLGLSERSLAAYRLPGPGGLEPVSFEPHREDTEDIQEAAKIVAGGRGLKKGENFALLAPLAKALDAHLGASREAVDKGWHPYAGQIGLSGKTVTPELYIALGISGAIQHLAGMQTSGTIVAVNSDPAAQIFSICDFGIVGDLFDLVPRITCALERRKAHG